jgi:hypothetical protein
MMREHAVSDRRLSSVTLVLYWGTIVLGITLPWLLEIGVDVVVRHRPLVQTVRSFPHQLFAPGRNQFLIGTLNAAPFLLFAVFLLLHLGKASVHGRDVSAQRLSGVVVALVAAFALSAYGNLAILTAHGSTAAIGYVFLPQAVAVMMVLGYGVGRGIGYLRRR